MMKGFGRATIAIVMATAITIGVTGSALAAPKGGGGASKSTLELQVVTDPAVTESTAVVEPHYGDQITFEISTTADQPFVNVRCYQGEEFVYDFWAGFYVGAWGGETFNLTSDYWVGGDADCTARLVAWVSNGRERTLASLNFHVLP
jgi:hypothetical protein